MKKIRKMVLFIYMLLTACAFFNPGLVEAEPYPVGIHHIPPFSVIEKSGAYKGVLVEVLENTLKKAGISYKVTPVPQKRMYKDLATGDVAISMGAKGVALYEGKL